jgi:hypothetical protein
MGLLSDSQRRILVGAHRDLAEFLDRPWDNGSAYRSRSQVTWRRAILDARDGIVGVNWNRWQVSVETSAQRMRRSRDLASLEATGLLNRVRTRGKTTRVELTEAGHRVANAILEKKSK